MTNRIKLEFNSLPENVALARLVIASVAGHTDLTLSDIEELKVAVSEAVSNSIIHGYGNKSDGIIKLEVWQDADKLEIWVADQGVGIEDIEQAMEPAFSTVPDRMGLGFVFMKSFMDDVHVDSVPQQGTTVKLVKYIADTAVQALNN